MTTFLAGLYLGFLGGAVSGLIITWVIDMRMQRHLHRMVQGGQS